MARVKLEEEQEQWEPQEEQHRVLTEFKQEPEIRGVQISEDNSSVFCFKKEEPEEVEIKAEPLEFPLVRESVKSEEGESQTAPEESREDADGAGLSGEHGENSSDTDDSEDWTPSAPQTHSEGNREESAGDGCSSDSESSWEFDAPTKTPVKSKRQMEEYPDWTPQKKEHKCSDCGKVFHYDARLREHQLNHSHKCSVCAKEFREKRALRIHMRTHTGEKPFKCSVCSKGFKQIPHLYIHKRTHTGEKPFKCSVCFREFSAKTSLNRHMKVHTRSKQMIS